MPKPFAARRLAGPVRARLAAPTASPVATVAA
jgi:hypothetical protein